MTKHWNTTFVSLCDRRQRSVVIRHLLQQWYLQQQRVGVSVTIGFLVRDRLRIKIRIRVGVTFDASVNHWSTCRRSKYLTFRSVNTHASKLPILLYSGHSIWWERCLWQDRDDTSCHLSSRNTAERGKDYNHNKTYLLGVENNIWHFWSLITFHTMIRYM